MEELRDRLRNTENKVDRDERIKKMMNEKVLPNLLSINVQTLHS
jgi:hypothetical protein